MNIRVLLLGLLLSGASFGQITIDRTDPVIERKAFDPHHPPADMPKLSPIENAVTQSYFGVEGRVGGPVIERVKTDSGYAATVRVGSASMTLRMRVTIWLPTSANAKIANHEEGHRKLAELYYQDAQAIAQKCAQELMGQTFTGSGPTSDAAADNALMDAYKQVAKKYMNLTDVPCGAAQDDYDEITAHGTNAVKEDKAIEQAMAQVKARTTK